MILQSPPETRLPVLNIVSKRALFGPFVLGGQAMPASGSATLEDVLSVGRSHPHAETVCLVSLAVVRLKSALHFVCLNRLGLDGELYLRGGLGALGSRPGDLRGK